MPLHQTTPFAPEGLTAGDAPRVEQPLRHRYDLLVLTLLCAFVLVFGVLKGASRPLWSDELATVHIADAPSWHEMLERGHQADLNPPLLTALVRLSFGLFGAHELGARLPSIVSFMVATAALFLFLRRRLSLPFATLGALLPICNLEIRYYLTEARPYALLLATVLVALWAYDAVVRESRVVLARCVLAIAMTAMLQAHLFGSLAMVAFVLAEAVRSIRLRRLDPWTALAILLPCLTCVTYAPLLHPQGAAPVLIYREHDRSSLRRGLAFYPAYLFWPWVGLAKGSVIVGLCVWPFSKNSRRRFTGFPAEFWVLFVVLTATPLLITLAFHLHSPGSAFYPRYAIAAVVPALIVFAGVLAWAVSNNNIAGWLLVGAAIVVFARGLRDEDWQLRNVRQQGLLSAPSGFNSTAGVSKICPTFPLVINNALDFLEADYRLGPTSEKRMVYVTSARESLRLEHQNMTESVASMDKAFHLAHHVVPSGEFLAVHPEFLVLSRAGVHDWFLDAMQERRAVVRPLGRYRFTAKDDELWYVSTDLQSSVPACLRGPAPNLQP